MAFARQAGGEGSALSEALQGLTLYYNQSDNFNPPATFQTDYFFKPLPKPTGKGKDGQPVPCSPKVFDPEKVYGPGA